MFSTRRQARFWKFGYDPLDRLASARYNGTLVARYGYDAVGRRVAKRVFASGPNGATVTFTRMIYAGNQVVAEADSAGTLTLGYTWSVEPTNLVAVHKYGSGSGDWYAILDPISSVRGLTKRDSTWAASWRYSVYGAVLDSAGNQQSSCATGGRDGSSMQKQASTSLGAGCTILRSNVSPKKT